MKILDFSAEAIGDALVQRQEIEGAVWDRTSAVQTALSAARLRLTRTAERCQQRKVLTNEEYYGGGRKEEAINDRIASSRFADAVVTRNHYGCLVLNAARTLFIDVDVLSPEDASHPGRGSEPWRRMFDDLSLVLADEKSGGFRIYRTSAGFRVLATAHEFAPASSSAKRLMEVAGADAAFVKLCRIQNSFRARLTPKPWRCGARRPPNDFPRHSPTEQHRFAEWLSQYERACLNHATCRYLGHIGPTNTHERIEPLIEFHDRQTRALEALPLA